MPPHPTGQSLYLDAQGAGQDGYLRCPQQYHWLRCAAANQRKLKRIVGLMQMRSRKILLETLPEPSRRKRLSKVTELGQT